MTKNIQILSIALVLSIFNWSKAFSQIIFEPEGLNMPGDWNTFTNPPAAGSVFGNPNQSTSGSLNVITTGDRRWQSRFRAAATGGDAIGGVNEFLFTSGSPAAPFNNKWTDVTVTMNTLQTYNFNNTGGGANNTITLTNGKFYTCNWRDDGYANTSAIFMETSALPVTIDNVSQSPSGSQILANTAITVTVTISAPLILSEEKVYVRYSNDGYASQNFLVPVVFTGTTGTATIPGFTAGNSVSYYVFTTTVDAPTADWDMYSINFGNNLGLNYNYTTVNDPVLQASASNDTTVCSNGFPITLSATAGFQYTWNNGPISQTNTVSAPGQYIVNIINPQTGGNKIDTVNVFVSTINFNLGSDTSFCGLSSLVLDPGITLTPEGDLLRIDYDATKGTTGLVNSPKVYMHSGVQFVPFGVSTNWVGNWGQDDGVGEMTSLGSNSWTITINPVSYYGYTAGTSVNALEMLFRNANGTLEGKDGNNANIFLLLTQTPPFTSFDGVTAENLQAQYSSIVWNDNSTNTTLAVTSGGDYSATVTDIYGCTATDNVSVTVNPPAFVDAGSSQVVCNGESVTLDAGSGFSSYSWSSGQSTPSITVSTADTYTVSVTDANGCTAQDVITIETGTEVSSDFTFVTTPGSLVVTFTAATQPAGTTYAWDYTSNGSTDNTTANPTYTFLTAGTYNVSLTVTNTCGDDVQIYQVTVGTVGIEDRAELDITIFPNPTTEILNIKTEENAPASLIDLTGKEIIAFELKKGENQISLPNIPSGIYFLRIINATFKINKQ